MTTTDETITDGSAQKFTNVPFTSQTVAHNNFMDQANFNSSSLLSNNNGVLEQRAQSVQAVPLGGLNYNTQQVIPQALHQQSANIPINHGTAVLNTGQVNYQIHHTNNIIVAHGKSKSQLSQQNAIPPQKKANKANSQQRATFLQSSTNVNNSYENQGKISEVKNSIISASGGVSALLVFDFNILHSTCEGTHTRWRSASKAKASSTRITHCNKI